MADEETCEVGSTLARLIVRSYNDVWYLILVTIVTLFTLATIFVFVTTVTMFILADMTYGTQPSSWGETPPLDSVR
jgi:hypothetical protein